MTFSIVARSADRRSFGVAISSSSPAVAARCAHGRAQAGAVATQNITDPRLAPKALDALAQGLSAQAAVDAALRDTPYGAYRQLLVIGAKGQPSIYSGSHALGVVGEAISLDAASAGNLLARADVPAAMVAAFESTAGALGHRLLTALEAGLALGGEAGPVHSAGLLVVRDVSWPIVDLRVDWSEGNPIAELRAAYRIYEPQIDDYVRRALQPDAAPKYGVPGED
jgi:uncharacterized Ntn-hydrolase superfamily protein